MKHHSEQERESSGGVEIVQPVVLPGLGMWMGRGETGRACGYGGAEHVI